jgi:hypothetical protein
VLLLLLAIWMDSRLLNQGNRSETAPAGPS